MMQHLALLCGWNSAMHFIPFQGFLRCSHGLQLLLLGHDMFCSDLARNDFSVLLSHQHAHRRGGLSYSAYWLLSLFLLLWNQTSWDKESSLTTLVVLHASRIRPFLRTRTTNFFKEPTYLTLFLFQLTVVWITRMLDTYTAIRDIPCVSPWLTHSSWISERETERGREKENIILLQLPLPSLGFYKN